MLLRQSTLAGLTLASIVVSLSQRGYSAEYYASPSGSGDGTLGSPFSLFQAANTATAGDTVYLRGGTYGGTLRPVNSGSSGAWITFAAYPGELPIFDGAGSGGTGVGSSTAQYIRFIGIAARNYSSTGFGNGWTDSSCSQASNGNLQFINVIAEGNGINGIAFYCASGILLERSIVAHNGNKQPSWSSGVNLFGAKGGSSTNVVRQTISFENIDISPARSDGSGFILDQGSTGATFENNVGFRNGGSCIRLTNSPNAVLINNTCFNNGIDPNVQYHDEIFFSDPNSRSGAVIRNTVAVASSAHEAVWGEAGVTLQNNLFIDDGGPASFFVSTDAELDFHLTSGASTLIDQGSSSAPATDVGFDPRCLQPAGGQAVSWWQYAIDYDYIASIGGVAGCFEPGARSGTPDIGAYEFAVGGGTGSDSTSGTTTSSTDGVTSTAATSTGGTTDTSAGTATTGDATSASSMSATGSATGTGGGAPGIGGGAATTDGTDAGATSATGGAPGSGGDTATETTTDAGGAATETATDMGGASEVGGTTGVGGALSGSDAASGTGAATSDASGSTAAGSITDAVGGPSSSMNGTDTSGTNVTGTEAALTTTSGASCAPTESFCGSTCADLATDPGNCGACGVTCGVGEICGAGLCAVVSSCQAPLVECKGACVDTASSPVHCGNCGSICATPQVCSAGLCTTTCAPGLTLCGQACVEPSSDLLNCGACGSSCQIGQACQAGVCVGEPTGGSPSVPQRPLSKVTGEPGCDCSVARGDASTLGLGLAAVGAFVALRRRRRRGR